MRVNLSVAIVQMVKSPSNKQNSSITPIHISNDTGIPIEEIELCAVPEGKSQHFDEVLKPLIYILYERILVTQLRSYVFFLPALWFSNVEKVLKGNLELIPSPSLSVKI